MHCVFFPAAKEWAFVHPSSSVEEVTARSFGRVMKFLPKRPACFVFTWLKLLVIWRFFRLWFARHAPSIPFVSRFSPQKPKPSFLLDRTDISSRDPSEAFLRQRQLPPGTGSSPAPDLFFQPAVFFGQIAPNNPGLHFSVGFTPPLKPSTLPVFPLPRPQGATCRRVYR